MSGDNKIRRWKVPATLGGGGVVFACTYATYTGHLHVGVTATVSALIMILMLLASMVSNVMPQKSEHRNEVVRTVLDHRRKMRALKYKERARTAAMQPIAITVQVVPAPRSAPTDLRRRAPNAHRNGSLSG